MSLLNNIGSGEMEIVRNNTIMSIAEAMYSGETPMPRDVFDYRHLISVEVAPIAENVMSPEGIMFKAMVPTGRGMYALNSNIVSRVESQALDSYSEVLQHGIRRVTDETEELIDLAISEAHTLFRERLRVPPLFLLSVRKETVKSLYKWMTDNTVIHEGTIAGIIALTETCNEETCFLNISDTKVTVLSNTQFTHAMGNTYNFTPILTFASSFLRENIPTLEQVRQYHKHMSLVTRYAQK